MPRDGGLVNQTQLRLMCWPAPQGQGAPAGQDAPLRVELDQRKFAGPGVWVGRL